MTGDIGNTVERANAEERDTDGTKTAICEPCAERAFYGEATVRRIWDIAQDGS